MTETQMPSHQAVRGQYFVAKSDLHRHTIADLSARLSATFQLSVGERHCFATHVMDLPLPDKSMIASMSNVDWAWEYLRRVPDYQRDYRLSRARLLKITKHTSKTSFIRVHRQCPYARKWGLIFMCNPELPLQMATIAWRTNAIDWVIGARAMATNSTDNNIDFDINSGHFDWAFAVITPHEQNLFIRIGLCSACLKIRGTSVLLKPVQLCFFVDGVEQIRNSISVLEVANAAATGDPKPKQKPVPEQTQTRRLRYLIAAEKANADSSLREIAVAIYGGKRTNEEWKNPESRAFKDQIVRAKREGISLMQGGYRKFLH